MNGWKRGMGIVGALVLVAPQVWPQAELDDEDLVRAASAAEEFQVENDLEGLTVLVGLGDDVLFTRDWGTVDMQAPDAAAPRSYRVGALSEALVAQAVLRRAQQGDLALEDELSSFFPELSYEGGGPTVKDLLAHTSGLPRPPAPDRPVPAGTRLADARAALLSWLAETPLEASPGTRFAYSEVDGWLLGWILEARAGRTVPEELTAAFFQPLGLDDTRYTTEGPAFHAEAERVLEVAGRLEHLRSKETLFRADELCSTAPDLFRWQRGLRGGELLDQATWDRMTSSIHDEAGRPLRYGLGVNLVSLEDQACCSVGGGLTGERVRVAHYPDSDLTVIVLADGEGAPVDRLERRLARIFLGLPEPEVMDFPVSPELRAACEGTYLIGSSQYRVVFDERLRLQPPMGKSIELLYQGEHVFVSSEDPAVRVTFHVQGDRAVSFDLEDHGVLSIGQRLGRVGDQPRSKRSSPSGKPKCTGSTPSR